MTYEEKFPEFIKMLADAKASRVEVVLVHHPEVLGDTHEEIVESLDRLADAYLILKILPRCNRMPVGTDTLQ